MRFKSVALSLLLFSFALVARSQPGLLIDVDLFRQTVILLRDGQVIASSPISSGKTGHSTPRGQFSIITKDLKHYSATYGMIVDGRGSVLVRDANSSMALPTGARFIRAPMPYFLGFTPKHGLHAGRLPGYPASHGCVRMPSDMARYFFETIPLGTRVFIHGQAR